MKTLPPPKICLLGLSLLFFVLDQLAKTWFLQTLHEGESWQLLPGIFHLTLVYNTGAAFSMLREHPAILLTLTSVVFLGFLAFGLSRRAYTQREVLAYGLILGGALGNIADRLQYGKVVDYLSVVAIHYPVFNLADSFIFCGVALLLLQHVPLPGRGSSAPDAR